jgi:hypothetical protein
MEGSSLMPIQDIAPERIRTGEFARIDAETEAIAGVEHNVHALTARRHPEAKCRATIDAVSNAMLGRPQFDFQTPSPKSEAAFSVQPYRAHLAIASGSLTVSSLNAALILERNVLSLLSVCPITELRSKHWCASRSIQTLVVLLATQIHTAFDIVHRPNIQWATCA